MAGSGLGALICATTLSARMRSPVVWNAAHPSGHGCVGYLNRHD